MSGYSSCRRLQQMTERILPGALRICGGMDGLGKVLDHPLYECVGGWMDQGRVRKQDHR